MHSIIGLIFIYCLNQNPSAGLHCADVKRYNPKTHKESEYRLTVLLDDEMLVQLNWPNGGHLDSDDFQPSKVINNLATFSDFNLIQYSIRILKEGGDCFDDVAKARQCIANTKSGRRCKNKTDNKSGRCWVHR